MKSTIKYFGDIASVQIMIPSFIAEKIEKLAVSKKWSTDKTLRKIIFSFFSPGVLNNK